MAVQLTIDYETLLGLVDQLELAEQHKLIAHIFEKLNHQRLSNEEFKKGLNNLVIDRPIASEDSMSREDMYGDDGR